MFTPAQTALYSQTVGGATVQRLKVWDGATWVAGTPKVWDGAAWVPGNLKVWDGSAWV